jgi:hypothetical protein
MKRLHEEVVRVVLLDGQLRCITKVDISRGTVNGSFAAPREIFRPAIIHSAYAFVLVHNHPSGTTTPSEADRELTKRVAAAAKILQIKFLDHVIVGQGYFSFRKQDFCNSWKKAHWRIHRLPVRHCDIPLLMCLRRVSSALRFLLPDCQDQRMVHV